MDLWRWCVLFYDKGFTVFWGCDAEFTFYSTVFAFLLANVLLSIVVLLLRRRKGPRFWAHPALILAVAGAVETVTTLNDAAFSVVNATLLAGGILMALGGLGACALVLAGGRRLLRGTTGGPDEAACSDAP
jgi:Trk-type K+ transport system membrane component